MFIHSYASPACHWLGFGRTSGCRISKQRFPFCSYHLWLTHIFPSQPDSQNPRSILQDVIVLSLSPSLAAIALASTQIDVESSRHVDHSVLGAREQDDAPSSGEGDAFFRFHRLFEGRVICSRSRSMALPLTTTSWQWTSSRLLHREW